MSQEPDVEAATDRGCPCLYVEPCHSDCTCVKPHMSRGCQRCCRYGSLEQRRRMAEWLINVETRVIADTHAFKVGYDKALTDIEMAIVFVRKQREPADGKN